jgi:capsular exopolysaccharide synthesis family protein
MSERVSEGRRWALTGEQPVEMRRYLNALRRSWLFILVFVVAITTVAVVGSTLATKRYQATATIVQGGSLISAGSTDVASVQRQLETIQRLLKTDAVLDQAVTSLPGQTRDTISGAVSSSVDPNANIITVTAKHTNPRAAAAIADAVANALLKTQSTAETQGVVNARANLLQQLVRLRSIGAPPEELQAVRDRISELVIAQASIGTDLRLAQRAAVPGKPYTPRPARNGVIAFFAAAFLAVLIAIGRDLLRPRISDFRELGQLMNLPVLARVPFTNRRFSRRKAVVNAIAEEAYQTLHASIRYAHQDGRKVVVVTSALEREGKTTTAVGLAKALARAGEKTLLICADFRLPTLHERLAIKRSPGLTDLLKMATTPSAVVKDIRRVTRTVTGFGSGSLDVIPSGSRVHNPAELLFGGAFDTFLAAIGLLEYDYVVFDGPPLLGIADGHALAQRADSVLIAARPDRLTVDQALEMREKLERLQANTLGLVVSGRFSNTYSYGYLYAQSSLSAVSGQSDENGQADEGMHDGRGRLVREPARPRRTSASRRPR